MADVVKVVNKGLDITTAALAASDAKWVAWGENTTPTACAVTNTDLDAEVDSRVSGAQSQQTDVVTNNVYRVVGEITAGASRAIKEVGIFTLETFGDLFLRGTFDVINLNADDKIEFTIDTKLADGS